MAVYWIRCTLYNNEIKSFSSTQPPMHSLFKSSRNILHYVEIWYGLAFWYRKLLFEFRVHLPNIRTRKFMHYAFVTFLLNKFSAWWLFKYTWTEVSWQKYGIWSHGQSTHIFLPGYCLPYIVLHLYNWPLRTYLLPVLWGTLAEVTKHFCSQQQHCPEPLHPIK